MVVVPNLNSSISCKCLMCCYHVAMTSLQILCSLFEFCLSSQICVSTFKLTYLLQYKKSQICPKKLLRWGGTSQNPFHKKNKHGRHFRATPQCYHNSLYSHFVITIIVRELVILVTKDQHRFVLFSLVNGAKSTKIIVMPLSVKSSRLSVVLVDWRLSGLKLVSATFSQAAPIFRYSRCSSTLVPKNLWVINACCNMTRFCARTDCTLTDMSAVSYAIIKLGCFFCHLY